MNQIHADSPKNIATPVTGNIANHLPAASRQVPDQLAVVLPNGRNRSGRVRYTHLTFKDLDEESCRIARGLHAIGIGRGTRTVLMVKPGLEFFILTFALFRAGAAPVMVDPGIGVANLGKCLAEATPEAFIGTPKAHWARKLFGWAKDTLKTQVTVGTRMGWGGYSLKQIRSMSNDTSSIMEEPNGDAAAVLFTSGSTGVPKGAVYTHAMFQAQVAMLRQAFHIEPGEIDLTTFPLFALFSPALRMTAVVPEMDATKPALAEPRKIVDAIEDFRVTNLFASPALLNNLSVFAQRHSVVLPSLKRVISAGAPVPANVVERTTAMLAPGVQVFTPYGATEALPVAIMGSDEILGDTRARTDQGNGVCVGRVAGHMDVRIISISDEPIAEWSDDLQVPSGEIGEICVRGPVVSPSYINRPESTGLAKIEAQDGFFHRMGDLGYLDDRSRLWVCGRKAHRVRTANGTMYTLSCEAVFNTHPAVFRSALVGVGVAGKQEPVLCVELIGGSRRTSKEVVRCQLLEIAAQHEYTKCSDTILFHPSFPVDVRHNSKIFREKLADWATRRLR